MHINDVRTSKINKVNVPSTVKYLSEFVPLLPSNVIVNKGLCGVGATTCEIRSKRNSIILCPTKNLVESKALSENIFGVTGDVEDKEIMLYCAINDTKKIIATYDALPRLINLVPDIFTYFLLIDEYHVLFTSYHYRRKAVRFVLKNYELFSDYCFMTATPLDNFQVLEEIKHLPIIEYKWSNASKVKITIENGNALQKNLHSYIATSYNYDYNLHIFVNSIEFIRSIVKNYKLKDYRTVCSESSKEKAEKYNLNFARAYDPIAKVNFYTAASFEGVDLFDENGFTIIVADAKKENTLMDISTLMYQICGRIRNSKYNNQVLLLLDTRKYRYTKWASFKEFKEEADYNELIGLEKERVFAEESPLYQKGELESYNEEKDLKYYLITEENNLLLDKNLKNVDLENYNLIEQIYKSNISVLTEVQHSNLFEVEALVENKLDDVTMRIYNNLGIKDYNVDEIKKIVFPIFKENGINCNNVTLGKYLKPITDKSRKMIDGVRKTVYLRKML